MDMAERESTGGGAGWNHHLWRDPWAWDLLVMGLVWLVLWVAYQVRDLLLPLVLAWGVAYLLAPFYVWMKQHWRFPRWLSVMVVLLLFVALGGGVFAWVGPLLVGQTVGFATQVPKYLQRLANQYGVQVGTLGEQAQKLSDRLQEDPMGVLRPLFAGSGEVMGFIGTVVGGTLYVVFALTLWLVFFIYFSLCYPKIMRWFRHLLPARSRRRVLEIVGEMDAAVGGFFRSRVLAKIIVGFLFALGWWLAGVPYWFLLGLIAGLLNILPFASVICLPLAVLLKYLDLTAGNAGAEFNWAIVLWPSLVFVAVQSLDEWVVAPLLGAKASNLNVMTVLLAALMGASFGGVWGILLAVPVVACVKVVMQRVLLPRWRGWAARH